MKRSLSLVIAALCVAVAVPVVSVWQATPAFAASLADRSPASTSDDIRCRATFSSGSTKPWPIGATVTVKCYTVVSMRAAGASGNAPWNLMLITECSAGANWATAEIRTQSSTASAHVTDSTWRTGYDIYENDGPSTCGSSPTAPRGDKGDCDLRMGGTGGLAAGSFEFRCTLSTAFGSTQVGPMAGSTKLGAYVQWEAVNSSGTVTTTSSALSYTEGASGGSSPPQTNDGWSQTIASWPQDWYPSGSQNFINDGRTHGIECNGNVFQDTQGGWWVHLYARDRDDIYTNAERQKAWTGSWLGSGAGGVVAQPLNTDTDNGVTVALPALASMPSWGWAATFHQRVQLPTGVQGTTPSNQTDPSDGLWANDAGGNPWHWLSVKNVNVATVGGGTTVSIASPAAAAAYWGAAGPFLGSFNGTSWLLNHFAGGHSADPVSLGPAAKAWAAKGIRYQNSAGTQVGAAAPYSEYEILCTVWVNPTASEPDAGGPGNQTTINVYPSDSPGGAESKTHDPCSSGISVPVVGWLIDSFKGLACAIGSFFGDLLQGLLDMFGPPDISFESFLDTAGINFPFNIITGLTTTTESIISTLTGGEIDQDASGCFDPDVNSILESATRPGMTSTPTWDVHLPLPAPSSAGCNMYAAGTGMGAVADSIGDVFGYRLALRGLFVLVLYVSFGTAIVRAAIEKDDAEDDLS